MADDDANPESRFTILCRRCDRAILTRRAWVGREVECPYCGSVSRVPEAPRPGRSARAEGPSIRARSKFNFACPRCGCLLEAHTGLSGQPGQCPTCAARFTVPYVNARTGLPREPVALDDEVQNPTPLHAYAADGHQAPGIVRLGDGTQVIQCPRCQAQCPIDAVGCTQCGAPFTLEAAPTVRSLARDKQATASCTLGIVSLVTFFLFLPALLAIVFGLLSVCATLGTGRVPRAAVAGIILGVISLALGVWRVVF